MTRSRSRRLRLLAVRRRLADRGRADRLPDLRRGAVLHAVQIDQLAKVVDELQIDVFAFGILSDFRTRLFPGSARLVELADRMNVLQVEALCWCGKRATHNARTEDGVMVIEGEVIVVGDVDSTDGPPAEVAYEVLCRQHHRRRLTAARARAVALSPSRSRSDPDRTRDVIRPACCSESTTWTISRPSLWTPGWR
jgi:hypothetical protein